MTDYAGQILDKLLDRYERSEHYRKGHSQRGVSLKLDEQTLPDYWDDTTADRRAQIHRTLHELADAGVVEIEWARHAAGLQVARAILHLGSLDQAYRLAGRTPRTVLEDRLRSLALEWRERLPDWGAAFAGALAGALAEGRPLPAGFVPGEDALLADLLRAMAAADPFDPLPRRVFSLRVFGSSKHFEQVVEGRLARVLREFHPAAHTAEGRKELLAEMGVTDNPDHLFLAGPLVLASGGHTVNIGAFHPDAGLPAAMAAGARVISLAADQVLTVENLTTFHMLAVRRAPRTLLLYLGGYHNRLRREFLRRLWEAAPDASFLHWGDLDLGGFQIFHLLQSGSGVPLQPYRMDLETYRAHASGGAPFDGEYRRRLEALLRAPEYAVFHEVIAEMLRVGRRVEQEAIPL